MLEYIKYAMFYSHKVFFFIIIYLSYFSPFSFLQCELMKYAMA